MVSASTSCPSSSAPRASAVNIAKLRSQSGLVTLDNAFVNTAACESAITFIDGEAGILRYRGVDIEDLVNVPNPSYLETSYLLIYGDLPTQKERDDFSRDIRKHTLVHEDVKRFFDGFPKDAHPMATLSSVVTAQSTFYLDSLDPKNPEQVQQSIVRLMAKLPTISAYAYKKSIGQPFIYPNNELDLIENFLTMMFSVPSGLRGEPVVVGTLKLLILHADHEQNCSTSTVRLVGSSEVNIYAAIGAGINALWGPLHGGANQKVIEMLEDIAADRDDINKYVAMAKDPNSDFRLSGLRASCLQELRPRAHPQGDVRRGAHRARAPRPPALPRARARSGGVERRVLRGAQALSERRLLLGPHLPGDGLPHADVHRPVRDRPAPRLDRALGGDGEPGHQDRPSPPDLRRPEAPVRPHRSAADHVTGVSSGAVGGVPAATDGEDPDDRDQLTSEHDAHHVDGRIPGHGAVLDAEDADGSDDDTEAEAGAGTGARRVRCGTFAAAPTTAAHGGDGNDGDPSAW